MMKAKCILLAAAISALCLIWGCSQTNTQSSHRTNNDLSQESSGTVKAENTNAIKLVSDIATTQYFTDEKVKDDDVETILMAGINAPSAMNGQPWHFTVITDAALLRQISEDMDGGMGFGGVTPPPPDKTEGGNQAVAGSTSKAGIADAPLVIVISCSDGSKLDAGLACQNMSVAAQLLGYGTKIISSPTLAVNEENQAVYREQLGIPEDQTAAAFLLIGMEDTSADGRFDAYAGPTARNPLDEMVTYVEGQ